MSHISGSSKESSSLSSKSESELRISLRVALPFDVAFAFPLSTVLHFFVPSSSASTSMALAFPFTFAFTGPLIFLISVVARVTELDDLRGYIVRLLDHWLSFWFRPGFRFGFRVAVGRCWSSASRVQQIAREEVAKEVERPARMQKYCGWHVLA